LQRSPDLLYEPIAVQLDKDIYRLLEVHQLLLAQSMIQKLTMEALQQSQQALAEEKKLEQVTLQSIGDGVITTNAEGRIKAMNPVAERLTGWQTVAARDQLLLEVFRVVTESTREPVPDPVKTTLEEGRTHELASQVLLLAHNGQEFAIQGSVAPIRVRDEQIAGTVLVFRDVTRERALARQLSWQASHDALTGLLNRRRFEQHLEDACTSARLQNHRHTLCCFDLDQFKAVNDTGGHLAGDELLRQISALLQQQVRKTDVFARLGGDEFGLLLLQCSLEKGLGIAHTIHRCVNEFQFPWQEQNFRVGVSIGLAEITSNISSSTVALSWADAACYQAKKQGRNCVRVHEPDEVYC
jgi:diguanylate cyclase (GGDEF)-like protein/PAS domain S-box-containing protein